MLKVLGTTRLKFGESGNDKDGYGGGYFDPYFQCFVNSKGETKLKSREIPESVPPEMLGRIMDIKRRCYWMDESLFGINSSRLLNKLFGAREVAVLEKEYVSENIDRSNVTPRRTDSTSFRARRFGFGFGPLIQVLPWVGNYVVLLINTWILCSMVAVGIGYRIQWGFRTFGIVHVENSKRFLGFKDICRMIFNILVDFGIGFVPFVGMFASIIHRSNTRNLVIFWKSLDDVYSR